MFNKTNPKRICILSCDVEWWYMYLRMYRGPNKTIFVLVAFFSYHKMSPQWALGILGCLYWLILLRCSFVLISFHSRLSYNRDLSQLWPTTGVMAPTPLKKTKQNVVARVYFLISFFFFYLLLCLFSDLLDMSSFHRTVISLSFRQIWVKLHFFSPLDTFSFCIFFTLLLMWAIVQQSSRWILGKSDSWPHFPPCPLKMGVVWHFGHVGISFYSFTLFRAQLSWKSISKSES